MANNSTPDVFLLLGVEGGSSIGKGSGLLISTQLKQIMDQVEETITSHLKIKLDQNALSELKTQINDTVTEALTSIKGTPVELTFSFNQDSIDKAFRDVKKQLKEQNITISAQPQERKQKQGTGSTGSTGSAGGANSSTSLGNIKKEAEAAKQGVKEVAKAAESVSKETQQSLNAERQITLEKIKQKDIVESQIDTQEKAQNSIPTFDFVNKMQSLSDAQEINDVAEATEDVANAVEDIADNLDKVEKSTRINEEFEKFLDDTTELQQTAEGIEDIGEEAKEATAEAKSLEETLAGISSERRNLTSSTTSINDTITGISETSVDDETGRSYRTSVSLKRDKEGNLSVTTTDIETNQKAISQLDRINNKLEQYALNLNKVAEADSRDITKETRTGITETIERATRLSALLEDIVRSDDPTESLSRLGEEFHFNSFDEGVRGLQTLLGDINSEIKNVSQTVTANDKSWVKATDSVDKYKDVVKQVKKETKQLAESDRDNITEEARNEIKELETRASRLADLLGQVSNAKRQSNRTVALNKLEDEFKISTSDKANPTDAFAKGAEKFNDIIADINDKMREANQAVADYNREWDRSANSVQRLQENFVEMKRNLDKLDDADTDNVASKLRTDIAQAAAEAEQLASALLEVAQTGNTEHLNALGFDTFGEGYRQLKIDIADIDDKMREANQAVAEQERTLKNLPSTLAAAHTKYSQLSSDINNMLASQAQFDLDGDVKNYLEESLVPIEKLILAIEEYQSLLNEGNVPDNYWSGKIPGVTDLTSAVAALNQALSVTKSTIESTRNTPNWITDEAALSAAQEYNRALSVFKSTKGSERFGDLFGIDEIDTTDLEKVKRTMDNITSTTSRLTAATRQLNTENHQAENILIQRNKLYQEADNYYKKYQSGIKANIVLNQRWLELIEKIRTGGFGTDNDSARRALAELQTATKEANAETMTLWGSLKKLFTDHFGSVSATAAIGTLRNVLRGAYQNVLEIDKAITELRKVTNETESTYEAFGQTAANVAQRVGSSIADAINSTADFARLGFDLDQSTALAEAAMVYKNVGDGIADISEASESIISTIKAFNDIDASDAMSIIDKFNEVGRRSVELPTSRLIPNKWQIAISVKGWRQLRPREGYYIYFLYNFTNMAERELIE